LTLYKPCWKKRLNSSRSRYPSRLASIEWKAAVATSSPPPEAPPEAPPNPLDSNDEDADSNPLPPNPAPPPDEKLDDSNDEAPPPTPPDEKLDDSND
ncbi:unnamed protein product, partial [Rotaria socialis]